MQWTDYQTQADRLGDANRLKRSFQHKLTCKERRGEMDLNMQGVTRKECAHDKSKGRMQEAKDSGKCQITRIVRSRRRGVGIRETKTDDD